MSVLESVYHGVLASIVSSCHLDRFLTTAVLELVLQTVAATALHREAIVRHGMEHLQATTEDEQCAALKVLEARPLKEAAPQYSFPRAPDTPRPKAAPAACAGPVSGVTQEQERGSRGPRNTAAPG